MFTRVRWLKDQFFLMIDIAKLRSMPYHDADNRISNPTDLAAKLPSNLILIMFDMVHKRWRMVSAKTALCIESASPKGSHALLIAHPRILLCSFALDAIQTMLIGF